MKNNRIHTLPVLLLAGTLAACGGDTSSESGLSGSVEIDGSSTVFPILEAVVEEFQIENRGVRATVGISGTGGGFRRFCAGEIDISNASRPIREGEREECAANGVEFSEMPIAWDGLSVIVNLENDWAQCLTTDELQAIWGPESTVETWADVREGFPDEEIALYGPGTSSGTFDYFTEAINGESGASRPDYQASEDDNVLVQGVIGDRYSMGYFGYAYYIENADRLHSVAIDSGDGCVSPSRETIEDGSYSPLSRPLYIYVRHEAAQRPEVEAFLDYVFENGPDLIPATGYVPLTPEQYAAQERLVDQITQGEG
ncbi:MAG TPA: PstS family phosphate ABC transporter substrate-binding protein [Longimicrobiales bacterium]|nr:PstS family phosphate ABC transporter substrate-binding protein [Longimicrobiales bacterium]